MCLKFCTKITHPCLQVITFLHSKISKLLESRAGCGAPECIPLQNKDNFLAPATLQPEEIADTSKGSENTEYSRTPNVLPPFQPSLLFQSWCKQPCCRELVPVSGQDRAHRLRSGTVPRLSSPPSSVTRT